MNLKLRALAGLAIVDARRERLRIGARPTTGPIGRRARRPAASSRRPSASTERGGAGGQPRHDPGHDQGLGLLRRLDPDQAGPRRVRQGVPLDHRRLPGARLGLDEREVHRRDRRRRGARHGDPRHDLAPDPGRQRRARGPDRAVRRPAQRRRRSPTSTPRAPRTRCTSATRWSRCSTTSTPTRCTTGRTCSTRRGSRSRRTGTSSGRRPSSSPSPRSRAASPTST